MPLQSDIKFDTGLPQLGAIPKKEVPEKILAMIKEVRSEIGKLDPSFTKLNLLSVVDIIEAGEYSINGTVQTKIDLSEARGKIKFYRDSSEGGCSSCTEMMQHFLCPPDRDNFTYCGVQEHARRTPKECGYGQGWSPLVKKHYKTPCNSEDWKPKITPRLEVLIEKSED